MYCLVTENISAEWITLRFQYLALTPDVIHLLETLRYVELRIYVLFMLCRNIYEYDLTIKLLPHSVYSYNVSSKYKNYTLCYMCPCLRLFLCYLSYFVIKIQCYDCINTSFYSSFGFYFTIIQQRNCPGRKKYLEISKTG